MNILYKEQKQNKNLAAFIDSKPHCKECGNLLVAPNPMYKDMCNFCVAKLEMINGGGKV